MNETRIFNRWQSLSVFILALSVVSLAGAQESRNKLPKKQHKSSNAPFLKPAEAVKTMSIPKGFEVSVFVLFIALVKVASKRWDQRDAEAT